MLLFFILIGAVVLIFRLNNKGMALERAVAGNLDENSDEELMRLLQSGAITQQLGNRIMLEILERIERRARSL